MPLRTRSITARKQRSRKPEELVVPLRPRTRNHRRIALEWRDGAGELHMVALSEAQSWPYLNHASDDGTER
jgi:hypothetical protein